MNNEERDEARDACNVQHETASEAYLADRLLKALDALEAAEQAMNRAYDHLRSVLIKQGDLFTKDIVIMLRDERDTARAQIATLAEALKVIAEVTAGPQTRGIARAALKTAGVVTI